MHERIALETFCICIQLSTLFQFTKVFSALSKLLISCKKWCFLLHCYCFTNLLLPYMQCPCCRARSPYGGDLAPGSPVSLDLSASSVCVVQRHVLWDSAPACSRDLVLPASSWDTWHFEEVQHQGQEGISPCGAELCRPCSPWFYSCVALCYVPAGKIIRSTCMWFKQGGGLHFWFAYGMC